MLAGSIFEEESKLLLAIPFEASNLLASSNFEDESKLLLAIPIEASNLLASSAFEEESKLLLGGHTMSRPLQISADTAVKLAEQLKVPIEHLMHMPRHILLQKMAELASAPAQPAGEPSQSGESQEEPKSE